jgi:hypothetical protein
MKLLSSGDMEKLPHCKFSDMGKCSKEGYPNIDSKHCVMCSYERCFTDLCHQDFASAMYSLVVLMRVLKELDAIPKEAKP